MIAPIICAIWLTGVIVHSFFIFPIYNRYFAYAKLAMKRPRHQGFNQSQDWFWANDILFVLSALPWYWIWRHRKAARELDAIISKYPNA